MLKYSLKKEYVVKALKSKELIGKIADATDKSTVSVARWLYQARNTKKQAPSLTTETVLEVIGSHFQIPRTEIIERN